MGLCNKKVNMWCNLFKVRLCVPMNPWHWLRGGSEQSGELAECLSEWEAQIPGNKYCKLQKVTVRKTLSSSPRSLAVISVPLLLAAPSLLLPGAMPIEAVLCRASFCFVPSSVWKLSLALSPLELRQQWWKGRGRQKRCSDAQRLELAYVTQHMGWRRRKIPRVSDNWEGGNTAAGAV